MFKEQLVFFKEFIKNSKEIGSVIPSSKWAAEVISKGVRNADKPCRILEVGAGTGPITRQLLKDMKEQDFLTVCEINPKLIDALKEKLAGNQYYEKHKERVQFEACSICDLPTQEKYDHIIVALPFTNMSQKEVEEIFDSVLSLSTGETQYSSYEYIGFREFGQKFSSPQRRERLNEVQEFFDQVGHKYNLRTDSVILNFPPMSIRRMTL